MVFIDKKKFNIYYAVYDPRIKSPLFEVDEFLAPIISILNKKGYKTEFCCSGHLNDMQLGDGHGIVKNNNCYIMFKNNYDILTDLPNGFEIEHNANSMSKTVTMRKYYSEEDRFYEIMDTMKDLYEWVKDIPNLK